MDVKPRPLSCMKKLSLTCEIKLQIHRLGIEETLPSGPREAGSSPTGLAGPGRGVGDTLLPGPPGTAASLTAAARSKESSSELSVVLLTVRGPGRSSW